MVKTPEPFENYTPEEISSGDKLFSKQCKFFYGCAEINDLPDEDLPEVAFAGRSNVGKSSLINALTKQNALARTSKTPGRTQQLNFFDLDSKIALVDLPGYGYAQASKTSIAQWNEMVLLYLQGRSTLKRAFVLIDSRHGLKKSDEEIFDLFDKAAVPYQIILTKIDKIPPTALKTCIKVTHEKLLKRPAAYPFIIATSSVKNKGVEDVRAAITKLANS